MEVCPSTQPSKGPGGVVTRELPQRSPGHNPCHQRIFGPWDAAGGDKNSIYLKVNLTFL